MAWKKLSFPIILLVAVGGTGALGVVWTDWGFLIGYAVSLSILLGAYVHLPPATLVPCAILLGLGWAALILLFAFHPTGGLPSLLGLAAGLLVLDAAYIIRHRRVPPSWRGSDGQSSEDEG